MPNPLNDDGTERRQNLPHTLGDAVSFLRQILKEDFGRLEKKIDEQNQFLLTRLETTEQRILEGFPEDDPKGHREAHLLWIERTKERTAFWREMRVHLAKSGLLVFALWLGTVVWRAFISGPK